MKVNGSKFGLCQTRTQITKHFIFRWFTNKNVLMRIIFISATFCQLDPPEIFDIVTFYFENCEWTKAKCLCKNYLKVSFISNVCITWWFLWGKYTCSSYSSDSVAYWTCETDETQIKEAEWSAKVKLMDWEAPSAVYSAVLVMKLYSILCYTICHVRLVM